MSDKHPEDPVHQAIRELGSNQIDQQNRILALEALVEALLVRIDPLALAGLVEEYDANLDRLAAGLPPSLQRPQLWAQWSTLLSVLHKPAGSGGVNKSAGA